MVVSLCGTGHSRRERWDNGCPMAVMSGFIRTWVRQAEWTWLKSLHIVFVYKNTHFCFFCLVPHTDKSPFCSFDSGMCFRGVFKSCALCLPHVASSSEAGSLMMLYEFIGELITWKAIFYKSEYLLAFFFFYKSGSHITNHNNSFSKGLKLNLEATI